MRPTYDHKAPKKPTNLTLNSDLLHKARELDINLSAELEGALEEIVRRRLSEQWLADIWVAFGCFFVEVGAEGVFSDAVRGF